MQQKLEGAGGLVMAAINVPQSLANGVVAGVNPVFGLAKTREGGGRR